MSREKSLDKKLVRLFRRELRKRSAEGVQFVHATPDEVQQAAATVIEKHHETIKELADR